MRYGLLVLSVCLMVAGSVQAQDRDRKKKNNQDGPRDRAGLIDRLFENDADGDGRLALDELPERLAARLKNADANGDGFITRDELGNQQGGDRAGQRGRGQGGGADLFRIMPVLAALDEDGNGELSAAEIENAAANLKKLDKNGDGVLGAAELAPNRDQMQGARRDGARGKRGGAGKGEDGSRVPRRPGSDGGKKKKKDGN